MRNDEKELRFGGFAGNSMSELKIEVKDKQQVFSVSSFLPLGICIFSYEMRSK